MDAGLREVACEDASQLGQVGYSPPLLAGALTHAMVRVRKERRGRKERERGGASGTHGTHTMLILTIFH